MGQKRPRSARKRIERLTATDFTGSGRTNSECQWAFYVVAHFCRCKLVLHGTCLLLCTIQTKRTITGAIFGRALKRKTRTRSKTYFIFTPCKMFFSEHIFDNHIFPTTYLVDIFSLFLFTSLLHFVAIPQDVSDLNDFYTNPPSYSPQTPTPFGYLNHILFLGNPTSYTYSEKKLNAPNTIFSFASFGHSLHPFVAERKAMLLDLRE